MAGAFKEVMNEESPTRNSPGWRLWLVACLLFLLAAWQQPTKRAVFLSVAVVFGIIAARRRQ
jgi:hypothetical protein